MLSNLYFQWASCSIIYYVSNQPFTSLSSYSLVYIVSHYFPFSNSNGWIAFLTPCHCNTLAPLRLICSDLWSVIGYSTGNCHCDIFWEIVSRLGYPEDMSYIFPIDPLSYTDLWDLLASYYFLQLLACLCSPPPLPFLQLQWMHNIPNHMPL